MAIQIPYSIARQITDHAEAQYPHEVCGLLGGIDDRIVRALPITNTSNSPDVQYHMDPTEEIKALKQIDMDGLDWMGVYHSHPKSPPIPSPTDINKATESNLLHLIVSLKDTSPKLKLWQIQNQQVIPIDLIFDTQSIPDHAHEPLSNTQKVAIIATSILCVLLMLAISFSLLPPAPEITPIP